MDYTSGQYPAHFTASETNVSFSVPIHNDNLFEDSETFICKILHSLPRNVSVGNPYQSTITILKNDGKYPENIPIESTIVLSL